VPLDSGSRDMTPPQRYPTLDLLRVVAIVCTMLAHAPSVTERVFFLRPFRGGLWMGVDLFMLISGWLLGGQLLREASAGPMQGRRFYLKRWMRTLPPYYFLLLLFYITGSSTAGANFADIGIWQYLTHFAFLQVYLSTNVYMVSWSLCVEEHFYLLLPLIVWAIGKKARLRNIILIVMLVEAVAIAFRYASVPSSVAVPFATHMRAHGLFLGLLFAFIAQEHPATWTRIGRHTWWLGLIGGMSTLCVFASIPFLTHVGEPIIWEWVWCPTIGTWTLALLFLPCVHKDSAWSRVSFRGLQYAGELTFAVYLVHDVIPPSWLGAKVGVAGGLAVVRRLVTVLVAAVLLHHLVERPFLALRSRVLARSAAKTPVGA
jgi:peptidoglycan/LPS O-acetylase OafA/YrhL